MLLLNNTLARISVATALTLSNFCDLLENKTSGLHNADALLKGVDL